jgi:CRISPR-associated protein Cas5d
MLYDMDFEHPNSDGSINPAFFRATMENGIVNVPDWDSEEVRK